MAVLSADASLETSPRPPQNRTPLARLHTPRRFHIARNAAQASHQPLCTEYSKFQVRTRSTRRARGSNPLGGTSLCPARESTPSASVCSTLAAQVLSLLSTLTFVLCCSLCFALRCGLSVCPAIDSTRAVGRVDESIEWSGLSPQDLNGRQLFDEIRSGKHSDSSDNARWRSKGFDESIDSRCLPLSLCSLPLRRTCPPPRFLRWLRRLSLALESSILLRSLHTLLRIFHSLLHFPLLQSLRRRDCLRALLQLLLRKSPVQRSTSRRSSESFLLHRFSAPLQAV